MERIKSQSHHSTFLDFKKRIREVEIAYVNFDMAQYGGDDLTLYFATLSHSIDQLIVALNRLKTETNPNEKRTKHF